MKKLLFSFAEDLTPLFCRCEIAKLVVNIKNNATTCRGDEDLNHGDYGPHFHDNDSTFTS